MTQVLQARLIEIFHSDLCSARFDFDRTSLFPGQLSPLG
jgi:hypothetical protein